MNDLTIYKLEILKLMMRSQCGFAVTSTFWCIHFKVWVLIVDNKVDDRFTYNKVIYEFIRRINLMIQKTFKMFCKCCKGNIN